jgi:hypothetical protein
MFTCRIWDLGAGLTSGAVHLGARFEPIEMGPETLQSDIACGKVGRPNLLQRRIDSFLISMHGP